MFNQIFPGISRRQFISIYSKQHGNMKEHLEFIHIFETKWRIQTNVLICAYIPSKVKSRMNSDIYTKQNAKSSRVRTLMHLCQKKWKTRISSHMHTKWYGRQSQNHDFAHVLNISMGKPKQNSELSNIRGREKFKRHSEFTHIFQSIWNTIMTS